MAAAPGRENANAGAPLAAELEPPNDTPGAAAVGGLESAGVGARENTEVAGAAAPLAEKLKVAALPEALGRAPETAAAELATEGKENAGAGAELAAALPPNETAGVDGAVSAALAGTPPPKENGTPEAPPPPGAANEPKEKGLGAPSPGAAAASAAGAAGAADAAADRVAGLVASILPPATVPVPAPAPATELSKTSRLTVVATAAVTSGVAVAAGMPARRLGTVAGTSTMAFMTAMDNTPWPESKNSSGRGGKDSPSKKPRRDFSTGLREFRLMQAPSTTPGRPRGTWGENPHTMGKRAKHMRTQLANPLNTHGGRHARALPA